MSYGLITSLDAIGIEKILTEAHEIFSGTLRVLEIGVCHGDTSRGIKEFLDKNEIPFTYYGIDNERDRKIEPPFENANIIIGNSEEVYNKVPDGFHVVFVDGCHCVNHVMLDFLHYSPKVVAGGFVVFHDTSPDMQGREPQHGLLDNVDLSISVLKAIKLLRLETRTDWKKVCEIYYSGEPGGIMAYRRLK